MSSSFKDIKYGKDQLYRVWQYVIGVESLQSDDPRGINYKTKLISRAHSTESVVNGYLTQVKYYGSEGDEDSLFLCVDVVYDDATQSRMTSRKYITEHGDVGDYEKIGIKRYTVRQWSRVQARRRDNIVQELTAQVGAFGVLPYVQAMLLELDNKVNAYVSTYDTGLIQAISVYGGDWLETDVAEVLGLPESMTLRQAIIGALDYDRKVIG